MFRYLLGFGIAYALAVIVVGLVAAFAPIGNNGGLSVAALLVGAVYASGRFVKEQQRVPDRSEKWRLAWGSLLTSVPVSVMLAGGYLAISGEAQSLEVMVAALSEIRLPIVAAVVVLMLLVHLAVLWFAYGWFASWQHKALVRREPG